MWQSYLVSLLVKLAAMASVASVLARSSAFQGLLMREGRSLRQRLAFSLWLSIVFGASVATRVVSRTYHGADLGLEGSLLAGLLGGYVTGLASGIVISLPAVFMPALFGGENQPLTLAILASIGVFGGLVRDCSPDPEEIWRFSPFFDLSIYRFFKESREHRRTALHLLMFAAILFAEFLRQTFGPHIFNLYMAVAPRPEPQWVAQLALYLTTLFAVAVPLKIWNSTRNEKKLEEQKRLLVEARMAALTSQINPHFLFNTLNSVSSLIRTDPDQARLMVVKLSKVLRRLLRKHENFNPLREELSFIEDYLSIELIRFGEKLRFERDVAEDTLDMLVPSMLLQPLVENSIKHGLSSKVEGGTIRVAARRSASKVHLMVEDDGVGIPESELGALLQRGIGVSNVHERLEVLFGNDYRMWVESRPGEGTRIQIEIPELHFAAPAVAGTAG
ncbi:MAG: sensor histidine kinase [Acidobacteriia bacterium]|nr:sensor histidine kinase [Terriglobia bacterium]